MVYEKTLGIIGVCVILIVLVGAFVFSSFVNTPLIQQALDFNISGSNDCLRFLTRDVNVVYVPFVTGPSEGWYLTVECTDVATPKGWVDLYLFDGFWDEGVNNTCKSEDIYSILEDVQSLDFELSLDNSYSEIFGGEELESYTLFFIFPPGGLSSFHVTLTQLPER